MIITAKQASELTSMNLNYAVKLELENDKIAYLEKHMYDN